MRAIHVRDDRYGPFEKGKEYELTRIYSLNGETYCSVRGFGAGWGINRFETISEKEPDDWL